MDKEVKYHGRLDEAAVEDLKRRHGDVFELVVPMDDEGREFAVGYVKKPNRKVLSATISLIERDPVKATEILMENCWIAGFERIKTDDELFFGASAGMGDLIKVRTGALKKK